MKKRLFAIIFAIGLSVSINASQTNAQSGAFRIDVPFAFTANNTKLPAGTYIVSPASDSRTLWTLQGAHDKPGVFLMAGSLSSPRQDGDLRLTFRRYGERNFLIGFRSFSYEVGLAKSASEKDFERTWNDVAQNISLVVEAGDTN